MSVTSVGHPGSSPTQGTETSKTARSGKAAAAEKGKGAESSSAAKGASGDAKADISAKGREFAHAQAAASGAPDVREEKIAELKRRIAAGKYGVDSNAVADKMVDEHLQMSGIG